MPKEKKINRVLQNPFAAAIFLNHRGLLNWMPDKSFLKLMYRAYIGKKLDLKHPKTYNEKLQWIKLYDRKDEYTRNADKYLVRDFIKQTIGEDYLIPLIGVYRHPDEIPWKGLPKKCVIKCNHASHTNIICEDIDQLDIEDAKKKLVSWLKLNLYYHGREWCYKNIKPLIICEQYLETKSGTIPNDYKFMCFNGEPKLIQVHENRGKENYSLSYYSPDWQRIDMKRIDAPTNKSLVDKPKKLEEMLSIAKRLAANTYYCRIDLYYEDDKVYFGEITYYPTSGFSTFDDDTTDLLLGSYIKLPIDE